MSCRIIMPGMPIMPAMTAMHEDMQKRAS